MGVAKEPTGRVFGRLTVVRRLEGQARAKYVCRCACGTQTVIELYRLVSGETRSCSCLWLDAPHLFKPTHGRSGDPIHQQWLSMHNRCYLPTHTEYHRYGARGIKVCERWHSFESFLADMGECPPGRSIEREKNDEGYCLENCRWATAKEQANNRRSNIRVTLEGRTQTLKQWTEEYGVPYARVYARVKVLGWTPARALRSA